MIPGAIDVHTHMELPFGGTFAKDTFETGTRAAAFGGTTTIVDFAVQSKGHSLREGLDAWHAKAEGNAVVDYGFHMIMSDVTDASLEEMDQLVAEGIPDFKLFTAYPGVFYSDDAAIFRAMLRTRENGGLIMMHAENGPAIDIVAAGLVAQGKTDPYYHGVARNPVFEGEASNRVIRLAEAAGVPVYIVHLSVIDALEAIREARDRGAMAFAETCPQYLFLSLDDLGNGFEGSKFVCSPPLREQHPNWEELWIALRKNDLQVVSTDHCPFDFHGQKELGRGDFRKIPNGLPGVEDRVDLLHDGGVVAGKISRERWVEIIATEPATLFGMYPRKGAIAVGADADLVVYDPDRRRTISARSHHMDVDYSCYEGREVQGALRCRPEPRVGRRAGRRVQGPHGPRPVPQARARRLRPARLGCRHVRHARPLPRQARAPGRLHRRHPVQPRGVDPRARQPPVRRDPVRRGPDPVRPLRVVRRRGRGRRPQGDAALPRLAGGRRGLLRRAALRGALRRAVPGDAARVTELPAIPAFALGRLPRITFGEGSFGGSRGSRRGTAPASCWSPAGGRWRRRAVARSSSTGSPPQGWSSRARSR